MAEIIIRSVIGFIVQIAPAAVLCLLPFDGRFRVSTKRAWMEAGALVVAGLVPFLLIATGAHFAPQSAVAEARSILQNLVFLVTVAALFILYVRVVRAEVSHKAFVFSLVMLYGFLVTFTSSNVSYLLGFDENDGQMYYPSRLVVLTLTNAVFFAAMASIMRSVKRAFASQITSATWWRMTALLTMIVVTLLVGGWLLPFDFAGMYFSLGFVVAIDCVALIWWLLRTLREASAQAEQQVRLERALLLHELKHAELSSKLAQAQSRVTELEKREAAPPQEEPVVLSTPTQAVSFAPADVTHVDSLNRVRAIHFADGTSVRLNMPLRQIAEALPRNRFVYCHRSIVVNLEHVRSVSAAEITLDNGSTLPVSRRRLADLREALDRAPHDAAGEVRA